MAFDTVYYSHFWYSRFAGITLEGFDGNYLSNEVRKQLGYLRILSIFFKRIYIPRTHLITQWFEHQWEMPHLLMASKDFQFLAEIGTLVISTFPDLDAKEDSERIISRSSLRVCPETLSGITKLSEHEAD